MITLNFRKFPFQKWPKLNTIPIIPQLRIGLDIKEEVKKVYQKVMIS